jgi:hypothetical protein
MTNGYTEDGELAYTEDSIHRAESAPWALGSMYKVAHLPLVAPNSALVDHSDHRYVMGRRNEVAYSAVVRVPLACFAGSETWTKAERELREAPFASKIAWDAAGRRANKLHATIAPVAWPKGQPTSTDVEAALREVGPFRAEIRNLFAGTKNFGRLYTCLYPERRSGNHPLATIQTILGAPVRNFYAVGLFNLIDDLTAAEAAALRGIVDRNWGQCFGEIRVESIEILATKDDLALDSWTASTLGLH